MKSFLDGRTIPFPKARIVMLPGGIEQPYSSFEGVNVVKDDGSGGRSAPFALAPRLRQGNPPRDDGSRRRCRDVEEPMRALDLPAARLDRGRRDAGMPESLDRQAHREHVRDSLGISHLMEMRVLDRAPMHLRLGFGEYPVDGAGVSLGLRADGLRIDGLVHLAHIMEMAARLRQGPNRLRDDSIRN